MGKTSGRGHKGHNARSGGGVRPGFEGGQMPLHRRLPKRGFTSIFKKKIAVLNLGDLDIFDAGITIDGTLLKERGLVKGKMDGIKILGNGELTKAFSLKGCLVSQSAREKIEAAGGNIEL
jgi:large subunit ribosomal protein L15